MNRRAFLRTGATTTAILLGAPAWAAQEKEPGRTDSELVATTHASIEKHRRGDGQIHVVDAKGTPAAKVRVTVEQLSHEFLFGCNLFQFGRCADEDQEQQYRDRFAALFNYCTLGFYWAGYEMRRGKPNYDYTDRVLEWSQSHGIASKGHPLVWDHPAGSPHWLPDDPSEIAQLVTGRVKDIVSKYRDRINIWDVVNEPTHLPNGVNRTKMAAWGAALGPVPYTAEPLRVARAANPSATLLVNDYRTDPAYYQILSRLLDESKRVPTAIGIQSHMHQELWPMRKVLSVCERYAGLKLPIHFTETTILSGARSNARNSWETTSPRGEAIQAEAAAKFYRLLFAHPAVQALTWWDFSDYHAWQQAPAGLLREDMSPKPVYDQLLKLIRHEWWTKVSGYTDAEGRVAWRGFYGRYRVTTDGPHHAATEVVLGRNDTNQFELKMES